MDIKSIVLITPEIILSTLALVLLVWEAFLPSHRKLFIPVSMIALLGSGLLFIPKASVTQWTHYGTVLGMLAIDTPAVFFKIVIAAAVFLVLWMSSDYYEFSDAPLGTYASLLLFATVGMMLLVSATDLLIAVIALELISIPSFILTGYVLKRRSAAEGAMKYFLVGTFSTGILLFGMSYYYGYFGSTHLDALMSFSANGQRPDMSLSLILIFLVAGLGFKLAMVPFHMWAPDAYEAAPTPITAFLSIAPKAAAVGFVLRLFNNHAALNLTPVLAVLAALTMTIGNVGALQQTNMKRLLAYSSIAQVGYILVALVGGGTLGGQAAMLYTFVYLFMNLGLFAVLMMVANSVHSEEISIFAGLSKKSFGLAVALVIFLLSLTGIPPMAGFIGKFAVFAAVLKAPGLLWLAIVAVLNSVVSLFYYFRVAQQAFFREADAAPISYSPALLSCVIIAVGVTLLAGILPGQLLGWVRQLVGS
jgi:NADH-quinone oxidoreductase subunit N